MLSSSFSSSARRLLTIFGYTPDGDLPLRPPARPGFALWLIDGLQVCTFTYKISRE